MKILTLVETPHFSQFEFVLFSGEEAEQEALQIDQTFYILSGAGMIKTPEHVHHIRCRSFVHLPPNTPYKITNIEKASLTVLLIQSC
jgi:glyoxylate utilization-related uncharacterized protein